MPKGPGGRPPLPDHLKAQRFNVSLTPDELDALDALCAADNLGRSQEIAELVRKEKKRRRALAR